MQKQSSLILIFDTVHGALRCLALFSGDLDDVQLPPLVPVLFPALFAIVTSPDVRFSHSFHLVESSTLHQDTSLRRWCNALL